MKPSLIIAILLSLCAPALAQSGQTYVASQYGAYASTVSTGSSSGTTSITVQPAAVPLVNGAIIVPFVTGTPVTIDRGASNAETVTPSAVTNCFAGSINCTLRATFAYSHAAGEAITSGTFGLQEAINAAVTAGSGTVLVDATWQGTGSALITAAAQGSTAVVIEDTRNPAGPVFYQWNGTAYASQAVNGVINAGLYPGADIGAQVNAAFATLTGASRYGTVILTPGTYPQTTSITIPRGQTLDCQGAKLTWASSTGTQVIYGDATINYVTGSIRNCQLVGTGSTNSTIAIYAGGDPAAVIAPSTFYGNFFSIFNTWVSGYGTAFTHGNNVWGGDITNSLFNSNANGIVSAPSGATNQGEYDKVQNSKIFNNTNCGLYLNNASDNWIVLDSNLDYNVAGAVCGTQASVELNSDWLEQYQGPLVNVTGTSGSNLVKVSGGNLVVTATPYTISNVSINGSNQLTLTVTSSVVGYQAGFTYAFSGLTTATFLNGTSGTLISAAGNTLTLNYSHVAYTSAPDTGTVTPISADLVHVEGAFQSYLQADRLGYNNHGGQTVTTILGVGYSGSQSGARTRVCTLNASNGASVYSLTGTALSGCVYGASLQEQIGSTFATQSPSSFYYTAAQGWSIAWNVQLNSRTGEMDFINSHGGGNGGFVWCDGAISFTPSTCQMSLDTSGNLTILGRLVPGTIYSAAGTPLPTCTTTLKGQQAVVSDASAPSYLGTYTSGGTALSPVICSGSNWLTY